MSELNNDFLQASKIENIRNKSSLKSREEDLLDVTKRLIIFFDQNRPAKTEKWWQPSAAWIRTLDKEFYREIKNIVQRHEADGWSVIFDSLYTLGRGDIARMWRDSADVDKQLKLISSLVNDLYDTLLKTGDPMKVKLSPTIY